MEFKIHEGAISYTMESSEHLVSMQVASAITITSIILSIASKGLKLLESFWPMASIVLSCEVFEVESSELEFCFRWRRFLPTMIASAIRISPRKETMKAKTVTGTDTLCPLLDGDSLATKIGGIVGILEGACDDCKVGWNDGVWVGLSDGRKDGDSDGIALGVTVGDIEG
jgi:hypothetical protein